MYVQCPSQNAPERPIAHPKLLGTSAFLVVTGALLLLVHRAFGLRSEVPHIGENPLADWLLDKSWVQAQERSG